MGLAWGLGLTLLCIPHAPYFRHWEMLRQGPAAFRPLVQLDLRGCGDLGRNAWIEDLRVWRRTRFSTDASGLRNPANLEWARVVVIGDSYVVGSGLDDAETITAALGREIGEPVYNYGMTAGIGPLVYLGDPRSRASPPEMVIWAPAARTVGPVPLGLESMTAPECRVVPAEGWWRRFERSLAWIDEGFEAWRSRLENRTVLVAMSRSIFHEAYHAVAGKPWEVQSIAVDGVPALVMALEAQGLLQAPSDRQLAATAEHLVRFGEELAARGSRFIFVPLPDAGTLYEDHYPAAERRRLVSPSFIDCLLEALTRRGVDCVDLRPALRAARFPYLFLRDDTHFSPGGAALVAKSLAAAGREFWERPPNVPVAEGR